MASSSELQLLDSLPPLTGQARIAALTKLTGVDVQDNDGSDKAVVIVSIVSLAITFVLIVYVWLNRNYRPIRARAVTLCTLMHISSIIWVVGDFQMNGIVRIKGGWKECRIWVVWVRILFSYIYSSLLTLRFFALDRIFNRGKPYSGKAVYVPIAFLFVLFLAYCLTCQLVPEHDISVYVKYFQICQVNDTFRYASIGLMWVPWTISLVLAYFVRNIQSSFNERYETMLILALAYMILIKTTVIHATHPYYIFEKSYRHAETLVDAICTSMVVWVMLVHPVYQSIFHRKEYEKQWIRKLRLEGQADKYTTEAILESTAHRTAFSELEDGEFDHKDPFDTIRMLSQNSKTLTTNFITQPPNSYRPPNVNFENVDVLESDLSLDSNDQQYPRRII
ncbi:hypothetical protein H4S06_001431 [Coemansia sp. BCRC 34490]|nr:hypothetical protein H4S06_001431 [Coemansia sp. BCRC 34490]